MTYFISAHCESNFFARAKYFSPAEMIHPRAAATCMPVIEIPRSVKRVYSEGELSSAARMLDKLRKGRDASSRGCDDHEGVMDVVVEKLLENLK